MPEFAGPTLDLVGRIRAWMPDPPRTRELAAKSFWKACSGDGFALKPGPRARDGVYRWHLQQAVAFAMRKEKSSNSSVRRPTRRPKRAEEAAPPRQSWRTRTVSRQWANSRPPLPTKSTNLSLRAHERRNRCALARPSATQSGKGHAVDRPHYQRRQRAADIVSRIRDFSKKAPAQKEVVEINEAILEIMTLPVPRCQSMAFR